MANKVKIRLGMAGIDAVVTTAIKAEKETKTKVICVGGWDGKPEHPPVKINQVIRCPHCEHEQSGYNGYAKGVEQPGGTFVPLTDELLAEMAVDKTLTYQLDLTAHPVQQVIDSTLPGEKFYYLAPGDDDRYYNVFVEAIEQRPDLAICTVFAIKSVPAMYRLGVHESVLTLQEIAWPENVAPRPAVPDAPAPEKDLALALQLIDMLQVDFDPATFTDTRKAKLRAFLAGAESVEAQQMTAAVTAGESPFLVALAALKSEPATPVTPPKKRTKKVAGDAPPAQALPSEVPGNVSVITEKAPVKRAARKKVPA